MSARVTGWAGDEEVDISVGVDASRRWTFNGVECPDVRGCEDIDLSFTPATNLLPIRRLSPAIGARTNVRAAWVRFPSVALEPIEQVYERIGESQFRYQSGTFTAILETSPLGFVTRYGNLWRRENAGGTPAPATDGSSVDVTRIAAGDTARIEECASLMADSEPWRTLQRSAESARRSLEDPGKELYAVITKGEVTAFILLDLRGPLSGYIQSIYVRSTARGRGLGADLVRWAEQRIARDSPNVFICVSSFNAGARRLYERLGYEVVGRLPGFIVRDHDELLLRKTRGPWAEFAP